jgi:hypothetical protein
MQRIAGQWDAWQRLIAVAVLTSCGVLTSPSAAHSQDGEVLGASPIAVCLTRRFGAYQRPVEPVIVPAGAVGPGIAPYGIPYGPNYGWAGLPGYFNPDWAAPYWSAAPYFYGWRSPGWIPWGAGFGYGYRYAGFGYGLGYGLGYGGYGPALGYGLSYGVGPGYSQSLYQVFVPNPACPDCLSLPAQPSQPPQAMSPPQTIPPPPKPESNGDSSRRPGSVYY